MGKSLIKYPGAKNRIASWIIKNFPPHEVYLEPFSGSAAVLLNKPPSRLETINDINDDIVNLFRVIRDKEKAKELSRLIELTPWSRTEYEACKALSDDPIERARRYLVRCWQGISGGQKYATGFKHSVQPQGPRCANAWCDLPDIITTCCKRLKSVQIEHKDGLELIAKFNNSKTLIYVDPPYLSGTRKPHLYRYEVDVNYHQRLLDVIKNSHAMICLSAYRNPVYDRALTGWTSVNRQSTAENGQSRVETLYFNYAPMNCNFFHLLDKASSA